MTTLLQPSGEQTQSTGVSVGASTPTATSVTRQRDADPLVRHQETVTSIAVSFGLLRDETAVLDERVGDGHRAAQVMALDARSRVRAQESVQSLLAMLSSHGFGWSEIARCVGVSVEAVRKWRRGDSTTGDNRFAVARLAALIDLLDAVPIDDPVSWLEMPVLVGYKPRHLDLFRVGRPDLLFELMDLRITPERALDEVDPNWRESMRLEHEVFEAEDGELSIRRR